MYKVYKVEPQMHYHGMSLVAAVNAVLKEMILIIGTILGDTVKLTKVMQLREYFQNTRELSFMVFIIMDDIICIILAINTMINYKKCLTIID